MNILRLAEGVSQFVVGAEGNISEKIAEELYIKASGVDMRKLTSKDIVRCNSLGQKNDKSDKQPSIETGFHAWIFKQSNINYIAHTHPTNTLKILCTNLTTEFAHTRLFPDQVVFNGMKSCIVEYAMPGVELLEKIKSSVTSFINNEGYFPKVILLKNHGIICAANSYKQCIIANEICEKAAEIFIGSKLLGKLNSLSVRDIQTIKTDQNEIYRQSILN